MPVQEGQQFEIIKHEVTREGDRRLLHVTAVRTLVRGDDGFYRVPRGGAVRFSFPFAGPADLDESAMLKRVEAAYEEAKRAPEALHRLIDRRFQAEQGLAELESAITEGAQAVERLKAQKEKLSQEVAVLEARARPAAREIER